MKDKYISIIMKNIAAVILVGMIAVIFFSAIWPRLFYFIAREELSAYICNSMSETAVRISYMLSGHRRTFDLGDNEAFFDSVSRYYYVCDASAEASDHVSDQECLNELSAFLSPSNGWTKLNGAIHADNYSLLITSDGTVIGYQGYEDMAEQFYQSNAHRKIMEKYAEEPPAEGDTQMINPYYPSIEITLNHVNTEFICCAKWFRKSGITFCLVSLMPVCDFQTQLTALDSISVTDYAFFCDDTLLFENKAGSDLPIIFPSNNYTRNMQYETTRNVSTDHITFSVLCSYPSEQFYLAANVIWKELIYPFIGFFRLLQVCVFILILILTLVFTFLFRHTLLRLKRM